MAGRETVVGPLARRPTRAELGGATTVLLCVPDDALASAAAALDPAPGTLVAHCSGASTLDVLTPHEAFSLHPLMTLAGGEREGEGGEPFTGATAALAGSSPRALAEAHRLATLLQMHAVEIADEDRAAYHAAATIASNFLVTLEHAAAGLAATTGVGREALAPLVAQTVANWQARGGDALTGPHARGDERTIARQRAAVADRAPELLGLYDELSRLTRELAAVAA
jgi:predicted short-subunit dehydrogenase-like oxidoreductase (DUF2520 family)